MITGVKTPAQIAAMREGGGMLAQVLQTLSMALAPGMETAELDRMARQELKVLGGEPALLGYNGYPATICVSVNDEVVHGIPGKRLIQSGDLVGLDFCVRYQGLITDAAVTVGVGPVTPDAQRLLDATQQALQDGIAAVRGGSRVGDIGAAVEQRLLAAKLGVIEDLCGHGVGEEVHMDPNVLNYGQPGTGMRLKAGMTIAIEPMVTLGGIEVVFGADGWTVLTADGSWSAQFEHTVVVTDIGAEILTLPPA